MRKLNVFNFISLDGNYKDINHKTDWHSHGGEEEGKFSEEGAQSGSVMIFGRITYEMMAGFWPSPMAYEMFPAVADGINKSDKIVFSKTLKNVNWNNTRVINVGMIDEMKKLKKASGNDMIILGSGSIVTQFAEEGLIDQYIFMVDPIAIGGGTPIFKGLKRQLNLRLISSRTFKSGAVLNTYEPLA